MLSDNTIQWMTENGFDPQQLNLPGRYGDTPLILASRRGLPVVVADLISAGADIHHRNMDGTNALWAAVVADSIAIAERLLASGADLDNQNDNGATVLMYAASTGKTQWVRFLLEKGADTGLKSLDDFTALDLASNVDILRLLRPSARHENRC